MEPLDIMAKIVIRLLDLKQILPTPRQIRGLLDLVLADKHRRIPELGAIFARWTSKCYKWNQNKCYNCGREGHMARDCKKKNGSWKGKSKVRGYKEREKWKGKGKQKETAEETNLVDEEVTFVMEEENPKEENVTSNIGDEEHNFDSYQACNYKANDERLIYYDWVADNATSSHITSDRDYFDSIQKSRSVQ